MSLIIQHALDASNIYVSSNDWELDNSAETDPETGLVTMTSIATKNQREEPTRTLITNSVINFNNEGLTDYNLLRVDVDVLGLSSQTLSASAFRRIITDPNAYVIVSDRNLGDIFSVLNPTTTYIEKYMSRKLVISSTFVLDAQFSAPYTVNIKSTFRDFNSPVLKFVTHSFSKTSTLSQQGDIILNDTANLRTDIRSSQGQFTNFSTNIGRNGVEAIAESVVRKTSFLPSGDGSYNNIVTLSTSNDVVVIDFPIEPESKITERFQFVNVPDLNRQTYSPIKASEKKIYSSSDWADDVDGILSNTMSQYGSEGLVLTASNGVTIKFTEQQAIVDNLRLFNGQTGNQNILNYNNPQDTGIDAALGGLLWGKLTVDKYKSQDVALNTEACMINLPPESGLGLQQALVEFNGKKMGIILQQLVNYILSAFEPSLEKKRSSQFLFTGVAVALGFMLVLFGPVVGASSGVVAPRA